MLVVSNTSPLLNLAIIDFLFLLPQQFGQIQIPTAVHTELKLDQNRPGSAALRAAIHEGWLVTHSVEADPLVRLLQRDLHQGESEAIALAVKLKASQVLLDEKEARRAARSLGLGMTGVLGVLLRGWYQGSVPSLEAAIDRLQNEAHFWIAPALVAQILQEAQA